MNYKERIQVLDLRIELKKRQLAAYEKFMKRDLELLMEERKAAEELAEVEVRS